MISSAGKEPSNKLFKVSFDIEKPAFKIIKATINAIIGSRAAIPVIFIKTKPTKTPSDEKISVLKCSASAKRETESDFFAT